MINNNTSIIRVIGVTTIVASLAVMALLNAAVHLWGLSSDPVLYMLLGAYIIGTVSIATSYNNDAILDAHRIIRRECSMFNMKMMIVMNVITIVSIGTIGMFDTLSIIVMTVAVISAIASVMTFNKSMR